MMMYSRQPTHACALKTDYTRICSFVYGSLSNTYGRIAPHHGRLRHAHWKSTMRVDEHLACSVLGVIKCHYLPLCSIFTPALLFCLVWNVTIRFMCRWYKEGNTYPLEAETRSGNSRDSVTTAVLTLTPSRSDDEAAYRCVVWNRAMPEGSKLDARVTLSVNCKSPAAVTQLCGSHDPFADTCIVGSLYLLDSSTVPLLVLTPHPPPLSSQQYTCLC